MSPTTLLAILGGLSVVSTFAIMWMLQSISKKIDKTKTLATHPPPPSFVIHGVGTNINGNPVVGRGLYLDRVGDALTASHQSGGVEVHSTLSLACVTTAGVTVTLPPQNLTQADLNTAGTGRWEYGDWTIGAAVPAETVAVRVRALLFAHCASAATGVTDPLYEEVLLPNPSPGVTGATVQGGTIKLKLRWYDTAVCQYDPTTSRAYVVFFTSSGAFISTTDVALPQLTGGDTISGTVPVPADAHHCDLAFIVRFKGVAAAMAAGVVAFPVTFSARAAIT